MPLPGRGASTQPKGNGLTYIDHLTHNVHRGRMKEWADFYERLFNFKEVRYFDIEGKLTGLKSKAMTSPCGKIRIPINESSDDKSQIAEYLDLYHGEGIQHIALGTDDIYATRRADEASAASRSRTRSRPTTTWSTSGCRTTARTSTSCKRLRILIDGATHLGAPNELLLQIFTQTVIGPIFFEIIQRKGDQGFGEGNFRALFESIELDQIKRGVLKPAEPHTASSNGHGHRFTRRHQQGRGAGHLRPRRAPAARRLRARARRLHLRAGLGSATPPPSMHLYRRLYERQAAQLPGLACDEFIDAVRHLGAPERDSALRRVVREAASRDRAGRSSPCPG